MKTVGSSTPTVRSEGLPGWANPTVVQETADHLYRLLNELVARDLTAPENAAVPA